jgi:rare lipoprotein A
MTGSLALTLTAGLASPSSAHAHRGHARVAHHEKVRERTAHHESAHVRTARHERAHHDRTFARLAHHERSHASAHASAHASTHDGSGFEGSGIASVYSDGHTASGEHMNPEAMTAAHRSLPFGTHVTVTNQSNGRSVVVRINDRGPFVHGRVIDLSPAAARAIGFSGLAPVSLSVGGTF